VNQRSSGKYMFNMVRVPSALYVKNGTIEQGSFNDAETHTITSLCNRFHMQWCAVFVCNNLLSWDNSDM